MNFISKEGLQRICDEYPVGAKFVKTVPFRHKLKPTSPRDSDTAVNLFLSVCYVSAVCELPVTFGLTVFKAVEHIRK